MGEGGEGPGRGGAPGQGGPGLAAAVLLGQPGTQGRDAEIRRAGGPGGGGMLQQCRDVTEVGPDGVPGQSPFGLDVVPEGVHGGIQRHGQGGGLGGCHRSVHSTVTLLARLRGLSTSFPSVTAAW